MDYYINTVEQVWGGLPALNSVGSLYCIVTDGHQKPNTFTLAIDPDTLTANPALSCNGEMDSCDESNTLNVKMELNLLEYVTDGSPHLSYRQFLFRGGFGEVHEVRFPEFQGVADLKVV